MTIVERTKPGFHWAEPLKNKEFEVTQRGSLLEIVGLCPSYKEPQVQSDAISQYEQFPRAMAKAGQGSGIQSPEILFANAETDEKLIAFVRKFGPVVASQVVDTRTFAQEGKGEPELPGRLIARQDLQELRNEQAVYRAALACVNWLDSTTKDPHVLSPLFEVIAANIKNWPRQWKRENTIRGRKPAWNLNKTSLARIEDLARRRPITQDQAVDARIIICELLNSFPSTVFPNPLEMHASIKFGIRPLLYSILRHQLFFPRGFAACLNTECRNFFSVERAGQRFCKDECSRRQRQRDYWQTKGKRLRKKRMAKRRKEN